MAASVSAERRGGPTLTVRDFIGQFKGLSSTLKRKTILARIPQLFARSLSACVTNGDIDAGVVAALLEAMKAESKPVNPLELGVLGPSASLADSTRGRRGHNHIQTRLYMLDEDSRSRLRFVFELPAFGARQDPRSVMCPRRHQGREPTRWSDPFEIISRALR